MSVVEINGIKTNYEVKGDGPPLLMYSPGGFDASMDKWTNLGVYKKIKLLDHLPEKYTCIIFDRRETGLSGGKVERISWDHYVAQGKGLLEHLGHEEAAKSITDAIETALSQIDLRTADLAGTASTITCGKGIADIIKEN